ncbi:hypothetical protein JMUB7522_27190 [Staphylococcus aureus]
MQNIDFVINEYNLVEPGDENSQSQYSVQLSVNNVDFLIFSD